jgi:hypothetical protein
MESPPLEGGFVHCRFQNSPSLDPVMSHKNSVHKLPLNKFLTVPLAENRSPVIQMRILLHHDVRLGYSAKQSSRVAGGRPLSSNRNYKNTCFQYLRVHATHFSVGEVAAGAKGYSELLRGDKSS